MAVFFVCNFLLEGSTDLQMILQFATKLKHPAEFLLRFANIQYTSDNVANTAVKNVTSIKKMFPDLKEIALFDNIPNLQPN